MTKEVKGFIHNIKDIQEAIYPLNQQALINSVEIKVSLNLEQLEIIQDWIDEGHEDGSGADGHPQEVMAANRRWHRELENLEFKIRVAKELAAAELEIKEKVRAEMQAEYNEMYEREE